MRGVRLSETESEVARQKINGTGLRNAEARRGLAKTRRIIRRWKCGESVRREKKEANWWVAIIARIRRRYRRRECPLPAGRFLARGRARRLCFSLSCSRARPLSKSSSAGFKVEFASRPGAQKLFAHFRDTERVLFRLAAYPPTVFLGYECAVIFRLFLLCHCWYLGLFYNLRLVGHFLSSFSRDAPPLPFLSLRVQLAAPDDIWSRPRPFPASWCTNLDRQKLPPPSFKPPRHSSGTFFSFSLLFHNFCSSPLTPMLMDEHYRRMLILNSNSPSLRAPLFFYQHFV